MSVWHFFSVISPVVLCGTQQGSCQSGNTKVFSMTQGFLSMSIVTCLTDNPQIAQWLRNDRFTDGGRYSPWLALHLQEKDKIICDLYLRSELRHKLMLATETQIMMEVTLDWNRAVCLSNLISQVISQTPPVWFLWKLEGWCFLALCSQI